MPKRHFCLLLKYWIIDTTFSLWLSMFFCWFYEINKKCITGRTSGIKDGWFPISQIQPVILFLLYGLKRLARSIVLVFCFTLLSNSDIHRWTAHMTCRFSNCEFIIIYYWYILCTIKISIAGKMRKESTGNRWTSFYVILQNFYWTKVFQFSPHCPQYSTIMLDLNDSYMHHIFFFFF